ncbi:MAG: hypothetical protein ACR2O2_12410 [Ruegeria sp.]
MTHRKIISAIVSVAVLITAVSSVRAEGTAKALVHQTSGTAERHEPPNGRIVPRSKSNRF